ncbi:BON domain-containing protein [Cupriavidus pampae]|uniref:BON domain-containing protein n=1 Tax=Cupriavidus pampae TaxID=659251 RepID=A0ABN7ZL92_9BURK|nr:BON domain-containing protein [Cupriavidus pampae]CAG9184767.1 hypothetical protein LMG32289_05730 [Cupriavidus pampae]
MTRPNDPNDYGRRGRPDQRYGGTEEGYGNVPGGEREWRRRDLSDGRYGNGRERHPYDNQQQGVTQQQGARRQGGTVYYPGRSEPDYPRQESPHAPGYVSAYSSGYEDGYNAGTRAQRDLRGTTPGAAGGNGQRNDQRDWELGAGSRPYGGQSRNPAADAYSSQYGRPSQGGQRRVGPKNYTRSDERLREDVCERLTHREHLDVSEVTVSVQASVVTLEGHVNDRRTKYEIEDIADDTFGVSDVVNHLHVRPYGVLASE